MSHHRQSAWKLYPWSIAVYALFTSSVYDMLLVARKCMYSTLIQLHSFESSSCLFSMLKQPDTSPRCYEHCFLITNTIYFIWNNVSYDNALCTDQFSNGNISQKNIGEFFSLVFISCHAGEGGKRVFRVLSFSNKSWDQIERLENARLEGLVTGLFFRLSAESVIFPAKEKLYAKPKLAWVGEKVRWE